MSYRLHFPETGVDVNAAVLDLAVHFGGRLDSIRLRSTETAVNGIRRAYPDAEIWQGERRVA